MTHERRRLRSGIGPVNLFSLTRKALALFLPLVAGSAYAQETRPSPWTWSADGNAFYGYNYQQRHFADFSAWESQNWLMGSGERPLGTGRLIVQTMVSLEPFTIPKTGSPQLFQTGETY